MYSKQEVSQKRHEFWTAFGQYMAPVPSAEGEKINWVNYKTGIKHIYFKMEADQHFASIEIALTHPALDTQKLYFDHLLKFKHLLHDTQGEEWMWALHVTEEGKVITRIFTELPATNIFNTEHWPGLISFFKQRLIKLDEFWSQVKYGFDVVE